MGLFISKGRGEGVGGGGGDDGGDGGGGGDLTERRTSVLHRG